jgi:predicted glycosyltransferase involved in capsule biosynthesis
MNNFGFGYSRGGCQIIKSKYFNLVDGYNESYIAGEDVDLFRRLRKFGKTLILNSILVYESPRRYRKYGYINVLFNWFMNWFYTLIFKKSFSTKW